MPSIEQHARFCVKKFGPENQEMCYMINSWIDAPSRTRGSHHRTLRHSIVTTPFEACSIYGDYTLSPTHKNLLVARMVLQHLRLDGLITPFQEEAWNWGSAWVYMKRIMLRRRIEIVLWLACLLAVFLPFFWIPLGILWPPGPWIALWVVGFGLSFGLLSARVSSSTRLIRGTNLNNVMTQTEAQRQESRRQNEQNESDMWDEDQHLM